MQDIPIGAMVDVRFSDDRVFQYGYFLGKSYGDSHGIIYCLDSAMDHPIANYKIEFVEIHGSRGVKPKKLTTGQKLVLAIQGKQRPEALYEPAEWPVDIEMAAPEDWTNNFAEGEKIYITNRGKRERVTVVTCFRDFVAFRWPVGSLDCRPASECSSEHGDVNSDRMGKIYDIAMKWAMDPTTSTTSVTAIRKALK